MNEMYIDMIITSYEDNLDELLNLPNLTKSSYYRIGDKAKSGGRIFDSCVCSLDSIWVEDFYTNELMKKFIASIDEKTLDFLISVIEKKKCEVHLSFVIMGSSKELPAISLDRESLDFIHKLHASIDFDLI